MTLLYYLDRAAYSLTSLFKNYKVTSKYHIMKKIILGAPGITGSSPELPLPAVLPIKSGNKKNDTPIKRGYQLKRIARSRRNLPGGK